MKIEPILPKGLKINSILTYNETLKPIDVC